MGGRVEDGEVEVEETECSSAGFKALSTRSINPSRKLGTEVTSIKRLLLVASNSWGTGPCSGGDSFPSSITAGALATRSAGTRQGLLQSEGNPKTESQERHKT